LCDWQSIPLSVVYFGFFKFIPEAILGNVLVNPVLGDLPHADEFVVKFLSIHLAPRVIKKQANRWLSPGKIHSL